VLVKHLCKYCCTHVLEVLLVQAKTPLPLRKNLFAKFEFALAFKETVLVLASVGPFIAEELCAFTLFFKICFV
jgi:hypothetical protein